MTYSEDIQDREVLTYHDVMTILRQHSIVPPSREFDEIFELLCDATASPTAPDARTYDADMFMGILGY